MAAVVAENVVGAGDREDRVDAVGGRWEEPTQINARGGRLDCIANTGLDEGDNDSVLPSCRSDIGICMTGEGEVP